MIPQDSKFFEGVFNTKLVQYELPSTEGDLPNKISMFVIDDLHGSWRLPQLFVAEEFMAHRSLSICVPKRHPCGRWNVHLEPTYFGKHHPLNWSSVWRDHASKVTLSTCFCGYRYQNCLTSTSQTDGFNNMNVQFLALLDTPMTQFIPIHQDTPSYIPMLSPHFSSPNPHSHPHTKCWDLVARCTSMRRSRSGRTRMSSWSTSWSSRTLWTWALHGESGENDKMLGNTISGWWSFGTCFHFPYLGNVIIPSDFRIFQKGLFYHPPEIKINFDTMAHGETRWIMEI